MILTKTVVTNNGVIPLIAALPFDVIVNAEEREAPGVYNPQSQRTVYAGRGYSTSRYDDSAGGLFSTKSDTQKDD